MRQHVRGAMHLCVPLRPCLFSRSAHTHTHARTHARTRNVHTQPLNYTATQPQPRALVLNCCHALPRCLLTQQVDGSWQPSEGAWLSPRLRIGERIGSGSTADVYKLTPMSDGGAGGGGGGGGRGDAARPGAGGDKAARGSAADTAAGKQQQAESAGQVRVSIAHAGGGPSAWGVSPHCVACMHHTVCHTGAAPTGTSH
jgi:hypothetical protein